jgi:hypothetical protein
MLYNQDWFQPFLLETATFYLEEFLRQGHTNLSYAGKKILMVRNYSNAIPQNTPYEKRPLVPLETKNLPVKIVPIAATFAARYESMGLPLTFWEYYALQLHRYILLAYLFLKYPETAEVAKPMSKTTLLHSRRKSISHNNYSELARDYKEVVFRMLDVGMYCGNFKKGRAWFEKLTKEVSGKSVSLVDFTTQGIAPAAILGYYVIIHSSSSAAKHIVSLFKCKGQWLLYDIDVGVLEFSPEASAVLDVSKMANLLIENNLEADVFEYTVTLEDGKTVKSSLPSQSRNPYKLDKFYPEVSMILVQGNIENTKSREEANYGGGRRKKTRKQNKRSKRRNRTRK